MKASHKRQLRLWIRFWCKVGALFALTFGGIALVANVALEEERLNEQSAARVTHAIRSGQLTALPILGSLRQTVSSVVKFEPPSATLLPASHDTPPPPTTQPPSSLVLPILSLQREATGTLTLSSPCNVGRTYFLEVSFDLRGWGSITSITATATQVSFGISNSPAVGPVFYRLVSPDPNIFVSPVLGQARLSGTVSLVLPVKRPAQPSAN